MVKENRVKKSILSCIDRYSLDAILFFRPDELVMSMGYYPHWGLSIGVIYANGNQVLYIPEFEPRDIIPEGITIKTYPWGISPNSPFPYLYNQIRKDIASYSHSSGRISFVQSVGRFSPPSAAGEAPPWPCNFIRELLKIGKEVVHIDGELLQLYSHKSEHDVKALRLCHSIVNLGVSKFYELLTPGISEAEISAFMESEIRTQIGKHGITSARGYAEVQSGEHTIHSGKFNKVSGKKLKDGDLVLTEFAVVINGYWADITRTGIVGNPNNNQLYIHNIIKEAQNAAFDMIKPGVSAKSVDSAARDIIKSYHLGDYFTHALGHGVGFRYHDPVITLSQNSEDILQEGMVITIEPGIYIPSKGGIRIEDNILVTSEGYKNLSKYTKELKGDDHAY